MLLIYATSQNFFMHQKLHILLSGVALSLYIAIVIILILIIIVIILILKSVHISKSICN